MPECQGTPCLKQAHYLKIKGNPNFQGMLNWILQILFYQWSKQHKNIKNLQFMKQNIVISFCPSLFLLWLLLPLPFSMADIFQFLDTVFCKMLNITSDHLCHYIKNCVYNNFNFCYFVSWIIESLYKSFSSWNVN